MSDELNAFDEIEFDDIEFEQENELEGDDRTVTIRTSGSSEVLAWNEGMTLEQAIQEAGLLLRTRSDFYLDNASIGMDTVLPAGAVVTAIGATQKGG